MFCAVGRQGDCIDLEIQASIVPTGLYNVTVTATEVNGNYSYSDSAKVKVESSKNLVFIQPDKPIYKPGQPGRYI